MSGIDLNKPKTQEGMQPLNALTFPLHGSSLIEASAGTGKTYTIVNLYVRLLLGHGCSALSVEQILVVTFTNAATAELRERIRSRLRQVYLAFFASLSANRQSEDPFVQSLIEQSPNLQQDCQRLALASKQMDEAAVYTIHGFCQKALTEHAFESGALYDQSFILDESEWIQIGIEDYWRKYLVPLPKTVLQMVLSHWSTPEKLLKSIYSFIHREVVIPKPLSISECIQRIEKYQQLVNQAKAWWLNNKVSEQLAKANLKGNVKLGKVSTLKKLDNFFNSDLIQIPKDLGTWADLVPQKVESARKKTGSADLSHLDFSIFETLNDTLENCHQAIKVSFSQQAIEVVKANLLTQKQRLQMLSPDDLLSGLQLALSTENSMLALAIRNTYPAALIDEFQDTDPIQFEVFSHIYAADQAAMQQSCWIMIGDPKQAIYAFRGADIYTYIEAKKRIDENRHFTLATNWRSAPQLVQSINYMFEQSSKGFLFEDSIPFYPVSAGREFIGLEINDEKVPCLHLAHYAHNSEPIISANDAQPILAQKVANQIKHWLTLAQSRQATINHKPITAGDCCVLVRTRFEASIVKEALSSVNVDSVFLSRSSVFDTQIAKDLFRLLKAMSQPSEEKLLKTALMSELFSLNAKQLDELFNDEMAWQQVLEQRFEWYQTWIKQGLMRALKLALSHFNVEQVLIAQYQDGLRRITDLHHLIELLQQQSLQLVGEAQLIHWFESCLLAPDTNSESQQLRLESDSNLVQIVTLHASKGLEFPLVFIPFGPNFKPSQDALYHNSDDQLEVDFLQQDDAILLAEHERLAEDIRLFYVAVTRAVYYCNIGLWNINLGKNKKVSGFSQSALGCLLLSQKEQLQSEPYNAAEEDNALTFGSVSNEHIAKSIQNLVNHSDVLYEPFAHTEAITPVIESSTTQPNVPLSCLQLKHKVSRTWKLTSYSAISQQQEHIEMPTPGLDEGKDITKNSEEQPESELFQSTEITSAVMSPFTFERGANAGSFLHGVLENIDFQQLDNLPEVIEKQSIKFAIDSGWQDFLKIWLTDVIHTPIDVDTHVKKTSAEKLQLCLANLPKQQVKVEMEFYMPLQQVQLEHFNHLINQFSPQQHRRYQFETLNGMIKGYIDLMFEFNGKFYVADYKSNHLGDSYSDYSNSAMEICMTEHDYHLQAILYTLALHRWLKTRLANYQYEKHIGGAYYLFIRGMSHTDGVTDKLSAEKELGQGVYFIKPHQLLIENLDRLISGDSSQIDLNSEFGLNKLEHSLGHTGQLDLC